jgi:integrase
MPCTLEYTDHRFFYAGKSYPDIPLLVDSAHHFVGPVCDYLRHIIIYERLEASSAKTYAQEIQLFWNFLESRKVRYLEVTDDILLEWMNEQEKRGNRQYVTAARCDAIFDLYCWLEINGYIENAVRIPGHNDKSTFTPMLSSRRSASSRFRQSRYGIISAIRPRGKDADSLQPTPTAEDLTQIYVASDNPKNLELTERNHLLIDWYGQTGVRRIEAQNLSINQIPDWSIIDSLRDRGHAFELRLVKTKGSKPRHIGVLPHLIERTREWIEGPRAEIVGRFKRKDPGYKEPSEVFISNKTGKALALTVITNLFTSFFAKANVEGHGHRIRAYYLNNLLQAEVEAALSNIISSGSTAVNIDWELILRKVAERAGHKNVESLRKYVTILKKKHNRLSLHDDHVTLDQVLRAKRHELEVLEHRIALSRSDLVNH